MLNTLEKDFFDMCEKCDVIQTLTKQAMNNLDGFNLSERTSDAYNLAMLAYEQAAAAGRLIREMMDRYEEEERTVRIELEATATITTQKKTQRTRCEKEETYEKSRS